MMSSPAAPPILFDRGLLRVRQSRALGLGAATFLLDRVAEDMAERLHAVLREFTEGADIGTAGEQVRSVLAGRVGSLASVELPDAESRGLGLAP
ncbi:MAG: SAM-dependent methyltransferase, partial [Bradyrhizobium sp.]|nr:SAM-dependent methyltransferase [Bradyrhizobium sp.]